MGCWPLSPRGWTRRAARAAPRCREASGGGSPPAGDALPGAARALRADRAVVLLDEPTAHLDYPTATALVADLRAALAGRLVVCVTHDGLERPGDTVVRLDHSHPTVRARV